MPDRWDAEAREWVSVEPDGKGWRVALVVGHQRSTVIALSDQDACEAYAEWLRVNIFAPLTRRAYREALEHALEAVVDAGGDNTDYHAAAIRHEIEGLG